MFVLFIIVKVQGQRLLTEFELWQTEKRRGGVKDQKGRAHSQARVKMSGTCPRTSIKKIFSETFNAWKYQNSIRGFLKKRSQ